MNPDTDHSETPTSTIIADLHKALARLNVETRLAGKSREPIKEDQR